MPAIEPRPLLGLVFPTSEDGELGIITLTTDFGRVDPFVAMMKGVILGLVPQARIVDIVHDVPPYQIETAAFLILQTYRWFPNETIHVVVVDPGVGSDRAILCAESDGTKFIAPDNGVLSYVLETSGHVRIRRVENPAVMRHPVSRTFHGRDIMAPTAAQLSIGFPWDDLGPEIEKVVRLPSIRPVRQADRILGRVVYVDRFGNLITNIPSAAAEEPRQVTLTIESAGRVITGLNRAYSQVEPGEWLALAGSNDTIEIARREARAEHQPDITLGSPVILKWS